jgi:hypothetical protein
MSHCPNANRPCAFTTRAAEGSFTAHAHPAGAVGGVSAEMENFSLPETSWRSACLELTSGKQIANFITPSFTGWGNHQGPLLHGGVHALHFAANDDELYLAGMGTTTDPAAGNGKQLWQRFNWREGKKLSETADGDMGRGLMETLAFHPGNYFVMGGDGEWHVVAGIVRHEERRAVAFPGLPSRG